MNKVVIVLFLLPIVSMGQAAQDSTGASIKNKEIKVPPKNSVDSTKVKLHEAPKDSAASKINAAKILFKPDSLQKFVDKNGDGYNDNAPDHDSDGIPDALDKDYWALKEKNIPKPENGTSPKIYGLDKRPGKVKSSTHAETGNKKPGIKFKKPQRPSKGHRGKR